MCNRAICLPIHLCIIETNITKAFMLIKTNVAYAFV